MGGWLTVGCSDYRMLEVYPRFFLHEHVCCGSALKCQLLYYGHVIFFTLYSSRASFQESTSAESSHISACDMFREVQSGKIQNINSLPEKESRSCAKSAWRVFLISS
jgi:hypothetical protein